MPTLQKLHLAVGQKNNNLCPPVSYLPTYQIGRTRTKVQQSAVSSALHEEGKNKQRHRSREAFQKAKANAAAALEARIDSITVGLRPYIGSAFRAMAAKHSMNAKILCNYILAEQTEINIKDSTKEWKIIV